MVCSLALCSTLLIADLAQATTPPSTANTDKAAAPLASEKLVDLNKASRSELKTLPGIGDAEAAKIVAARPFMTKTDLVTKNVLTLQAYDGLRHKVVVDHRDAPRKPKP